MTKQTTQIASAPLGFRPWFMLALGLFAQVAGSLAITTPAFLVPLLNSERGLSLAQAGLLVAAPSVGMVLTLILWGALADRIGERWVIGGGLTITALAALGALLSTDLVATGLFFLVGGMGAASANAAGGRLVVGWFPAHRRGLAMGIRQMAQPLGVAVAAIVIPPLAASGGLGEALVFPFVVVAIAATLALVFIVDPARDPPVPETAASRTASATRGMPGAARDGAGDTPGAGAGAGTGTGAGPRATAGRAAPPAPPARPANPYRTSPLLWRIHSVSVLLVFPQFVVSTFALVWLINSEGWQPLAAGIVVGVSQFVGALGRIAVGIVSDRVGSRMGPLRVVAVSASLVMVLLAVTDWFGLSGFAAVAIVIASAVTVADNGLAFTAVAEIAGSRWSGRALGAQNTAQYIAAAATAPVIGLLIGAFGFAVSFAITAALPLFALPLIPTEDKSTGKRL